MTTVLATKLMGVDGRVESVTVTPSSKGPASNMPEVSWRETRIRLMGALATLDGSPGLGTVAIECPVLDGSADVAIAIATLAAAGAVPNPTRTVCIAELGMDGRLRPVRGALARLEAARRAGATQAIIAPHNAGEASLSMMDVRTAEDLSSVVAHMHGKVLLEKVRPIRGSGRTLAAAQKLPPALDEIATEACRAGGPILLVGHAGAGKTLVAQAIASKLGPMTEPEIFQCTKIFGAAGFTDGPVTSRPFRAPHHTVSTKGLMGGGPHAHPGEISLATHGVLFLDDLTEFRLECLMEVAHAFSTGTSTVMRSGERISLPANPARLVAAMSSCPCGRSGRCACTQAQRARHQARIDPFLRGISFRTVDLGSLSPLYIPAR